MRAAHHSACLRSPHRRRRSRDREHPRQRHLHAVADAQPRWPEHGRRLVSRQRRHSLRSRAASEALPKIRRPRQQPRRLHVEHGRVARHRENVARVGASDRLHPTPDGAVSHAHLAPPVRRAHRKPGAPPHVAHRQLDWDADGSRARRAGADRCDPYGEELRRVVPRLRRLSPDAPERGRVLDRDRALSIRDAALLHGERFSRGQARAPLGIALPESVARRVVADTRRDRLHVDGVHGNARFRGQVQRRPSLQPLSSGGATRSRSTRRSRPTRTSFQKGAPTPSPRSSCCDVSRLPASGCTGSTAPSSKKGSRTPRERGSSP